MQEEILEALKDGAFYRCIDPGEPWAAYLGGMLDAGWLGKSGDQDFFITPAGLEQLQILRITGGV